MFALDRIRGWLDSPAEACSGGVWFLVHSSYSALALDPKYEIQDSLRWASPGNAASSIRYKHLLPART
jgi:hypothetical protein